MRIIPAIDLLDGQCVRLLYGDYDKVTRYEHDPVELARRYRDAGAQDIHIVDLDGARVGAGANVEVIQKIAAIDGLTVQSGGGVRSESDLKQRIAAGIDRVVIGSVAVAEPDSVAGWLDSYGAESIVLALDIRFDDSAVPRLATHGWQQQTAVSLWDLLASYGTALKHVLCTDIGRDGAMSGPNVALYRECVARFPGIDFQASGGVRNLADAVELSEVGAGGMITGKALLEGTLTIEELGPFLQSA